MEKDSFAFWNKATILNVKHFQKSVTDEEAQLEFTATIEASKKGDFQLKINDKSINVLLKKGINTIVVPYQLQQPKRWWPNGLGEAHLYSFVVDLSRNGKKITQSHLKIGLRTIELIQEKDAIGKSFYFKVNGVPVFMKGANYIPPDSFLPRVTDSVYKSIVKNAVDANMNMLRVWGGGVYADAIFYDECDANGILVWQDFMFACAMYPGDATFLDTVKNEVIDNVTRLQNHPSIALWCGNNESDEGWKNWGWQKQYNYTPDQEASIWNDYKNLFHDVIPKTLDNLLPKNENRYWPSSPSIGWGKKESMLEGDSHYWGVWWGMEPFEVYDKKVGRFMSEYGFQGMPNIETFQSFTYPIELNWDSEAVKNHQKHPTGYQTITTYMEHDYKLPKTFEDFIYVSQLLQANGMKTAIEAHRRAKPNCMGTLYWQLNDCWPVTSWSSVDYFGRWKAFHYQAKKSFENVLITMHQEGEMYKMTVINDDLKEHKGELVIEVIDFGGKKILEIKQSVIVAPNSSAVYFEIYKNDIKNTSMDELMVVMSFKSTTKETNSNYYFVKPKELKLSKPTIAITQINPTTIELTSSVLAKNVFLSGKDVFFSNNYFDILPNQKVQITLSKPEQNIVIKSLFDTIN